MQYFLSVFLAGLAITSALKPLSDYDWTEIRSPMKELEAVEKNDFTFGLSSRIVGGSVATVNQFPHQAALILTSSSGGQFFCGGSIIAAKVILTAAHCVYDEHMSLANSATIYVGLLNIRTGPNAWGTIVQSSQMKPHASYSSSSLSNDIAIIRLPAAVPIRENVQIIALPTRLQTNSLVVGESAIASGWGRDSDASNSVSSVLRYVSLPILNNAVCQSVYGAQYVTPSHICVSGANKRGTCSGDSGGPLTVIRNGQKILVGITSYGAVAGCEKGYPPVFTRVGSYISWLQKNTI